MSRSLRGLMAAALSAVVFAGVGGFVSAGETVPAKEAVKYLDKSTYTSAQIKEYYRGLKGKTVKGTGVIGNVRPVRRNHDVCVLVTGTTSERECNLIINTGQEEAAKLNKGEKVSFEGEFVRLTPFVNYHVILRGSYRKIQ